MIKKVREFISEEIFWKYLKNWIFGFDIFEVKFKTFLKTENFSSFNGTFNIGC